MLTCVFHPLDPMRVVEEEEGDRLKASGVWFDCPDKAQKYKESVENEIKNEPKPNKNVAKPKGK